MNILQMKYFITIVDTGLNLTKASKLLHISQPALSHFINTFEKEYNKKLFVRENGRLVELTNFGHEIYKYVLEILLKYDDFLNFLSDNTESLQGTVSLGITDVALRSVLGDFTQNFILKYPNIHLKIVEDTSEKLEKQLENLELDISVLVSPTQLDQRKFTELDFIATNMGLYINKNDPIVHQENITFKDINDKNIITFDDKYTIHQIIKSEFEKKKIYPINIHYSPNFDFILDFISTHSFIGILPNLQSEEFNEYLDSLNIKIIDFSENLPFKTVLAYPKKKIYNHAEEILLQMLKEYFELK